MVTEFWHPQNCHFPLTCCVALTTVWHYRATLWSLPASCRGAHGSLYLLPTRTATDLEQLNFISKSSENWSHICSSISWMKTWLFFIAVKRTSTRTVLITSGVRQMTRRINYICWLSASKNRTHFSAKTALCKVVLAYRFTSADVLVRVQRTEVQRRLLYWSIIPWWPTVNILSLFD